MAAPGFAATGGLDFRKYVEPLSSALSALTSSREAMYAASTCSLTVLLCRTLP